jgi:hypothetical protein
MTFHATLIIPQIRDFLSDPRGRIAVVCDFTDGFKCEILINLTFHKTVAFIMHFLGVRIKTASDKLLLLFISALLPSVQPQRD